MANERATWPELQWDFISESDDMGFGNENKFSAEEELRHLLIDISPIPDENEVQ